MGKSTPSPSGSTTESDVNNSINAEPAIDHSPKLNESDLVNRLQSQMPNLPIVYWQQNKNKKLGKNQTCAKYPDIIRPSFQQQLLASDRDKQWNLPPIWSLLGCSDKEPTRPYYSYPWYDQQAGA